MAEDGEGSDAYSEAKGEVLSELARKSSIKKAKELAEATQQEYVIAEQKTRAAEETVRKVHQMQADKAMDVRFIDIDPMMVIVREVCVCVCVIFRGRRRLGSRR